MGHSTTPRSRATQAPRTSRCPSAPQEPRSRRSRHASAPSSRPPRRRCPLTHGERLMVTSPGTEGQQFHRDVAPALVSCSSLTASIQISLVDTDATQGALEVIPGSHAFDPPSPTARADDPAVAEGAGRRPQGNGDGVRLHVHRGSSNTPPPSALLFLYVEGSRPRAARPRVHDRGRRHRRVVDRRRRAREAVGSRIKYLFICTTRRAGTYTPESLLSGRSLTHDMFTNFGHHSSGAMGRPVGLSARGHGGGRWPCTPRGRLAREPRLLEVGQRALHPLPSARTPCRLSRRAARRSRRIGGSARCPSR